MMAKEVRSVLKLFLPYGFMRRFVARRYGMKMSALGANPFSRLLGDLIPYGIALAIQKDAFSADHHSVSPQLCANVVVGHPAAPAKSSPAVQTTPMQGLEVLYINPARTSWNGWRLMDGHALEVDMICSLGGDCIAASQLRNRGMRPYSLPFDWCFSDGEPAIRHFAEQLDVGFKGFALRENMQPIPNLKFAYKDIKTGYNFMHHFHAPIDAPGEYERFRGTLDRRMVRFFAEIERSESVLFLLSRTFKLGAECVREVEKICCRRWPTKKFYFILVTYNTSPASIAYDDRLTVVRISRDRNDYDLKEKVFEWSFLDNVHFTQRALVHFKEVQSC